MRDGRVVGHRNTKETNAPELARLMVGRDVLLRVEKKPAKPGSVVLRVQNLSLSEKLQDVSLDVHAGEIVGIAGVEGNGQTELIEALAGLVDHSRLSGRIEFEGKDVSAFDARRLKELQIAHVPEDRHRRGLLLDSSLAENSILGVHYREPAVKRRGGVMLNEAGIRSRAAQLIQDFDVRPGNADLPARALSGGNQQKLIIGREFGLPPKLLLVSQPTRGVDIGAIEFIHRQLVALRDKGCAVLLVSAELEEVTALADRLLVIYHGRIVGEVDPARATKGEIGMMMTGGRKI
jgi:simple sugar transport system ATP-binding protein